MAYDLQDRPYTLTDASGVTVIHTYDKLGRLMSRSWPNGTNNESWGYTANIAGPTYCTNQVGTVYKFEYDPLGHKTNEVLAYGTAYSVNNSYVYANGLNLLSLRDGNGHTTTWAYDAYGRATYKTNALNQVVVHYQYDAKGHLTNRWCPPRTTNGDPIVTSYDYDDMGNLKHVYHATSANISNTYDALNRLIIMQDGLGRPTSLMILTVFSFTRMVRGMRIG